MDEAEVAKGVEMKAVIKFVATVATTTQIMEDFLFSMSSENPYPSTHAGSAWEVKEEEDGFLLVIFGGTSRSPMMQSISDCLSWNLLLDDEERGEVSARWSPQHEDRYRLQAETIFGKGVVVSLETSEPTWNWWESQRDARMRILGVEETLQLELSEEVRKLGSVFAPKEIISALSIEEKGCREEFDGDIHCAVMGAQRVRLGVGFSYGTLLVPEDYQYLRKEVVRVFELEEDCS